MKKWWLVLLGAGLFATGVFAEGTIPMQVKQLPNAAQSFIRSNFKDIQVASASMESGMAKSYEVKLVDGTEIDFDAKGQWTEVKCPNGVVPETIVPKQIQDFVAKNHPDQQMMGIERNGRNGRDGYEVWLKNGSELDFDRDFRLIGLDK